MAGRTLRRRHFRKEPMEAATTCEGECGGNHQRDCVWTCLYARAVGITMRESSDSPNFLCVERTAGMERPCKVKIVCSLISSPRRAPKTCLFTFTPSEHSFFIILHKPPAESFCSGGGFDSGSASDPKVDGSFLAAKAGAYIYHSHVDY